MLQDNLQAGSAAADRPSTMLEEHVKQLEGLIGGLERAALQYNNILTRVRGAVPSTKDMNAKVSEIRNPATMPRIQESDERLADISSELNNMADELNGIL